MFRASPTSPSRKALVAGAFGTILFVSNPLHAGTFSVLNTFPAGTSPGPLIRDANGNLYGVTQNGGSSNNGNVYELAYNSTSGVYTYTDLYDFCAMPNCADGSQPAGSLVIDTSGNLYGVTSGGGSVEAGTLFELSPSEVGSFWTLTTLWSFCQGDNGCPEGTAPNTGLTYPGAATGATYQGVESEPLFGTTPGDLSSTYGAIFGFRFVPPNNFKEMREIYRFCHQTGCSDGALPTGIVVDSAANVYGTTAYGGSNNYSICQTGSVAGCGVVFEEKYYPVQNVYLPETLYAFCSDTQNQTCTDAALPSGPVTMDSSGNLYGTSQLGGAYYNCATSSGATVDCGTVFKVVPNGTESTENVLYSFCSGGGCADGMFPSGELFFEPHPTVGTLYGTTMGGGENGSGTIFSLNISLAPPVESVLYSFCAGGTCAGGNTPQSGVIGDGQGDLFGTDTGGANSAFEWSSN